MYRHQPSKKTKEFRDAFLATEKKIKERASLRSNLYRVADKFFQEARVTGEKNLMKLSKKLKKVAKNL